MPQVVLALDDQTPPERRAALVSLRLSLHKIGLVAGGLLFAALGWVLSRWAQRKVVA